MLCGKQRDKSTRGVQQNQNDVAEDDRVLATHALANARLKWNESRSTNNGGCQCQALHGRSDVLLAVLTSDEQSKEAFDVKS